MISLHKSHKITGFFTKVTMKHSYVVFTGTLRPSNGEQTVETQTSIKLKTFLLHTTLPFGPNSPHGSFWQVKQARGFVSSKNDFI
jgi:hypothetical protein